MNFTIYKDYLVYPCCILLYRTCKP